MSEIGRKYPSSSGLCICEAAWTQHNKHVSTQSKRIPFSCTSLFHFILSLYFYYVAICSFRCGSFCVLFPTAKPVSCHGEAIGSYKRAGLRPSLDRRTFFMPIVGQIDLNLVYSCLALTLLIALETMTLSSRSNSRFTCPKYVNLDAFNKSTMSFPINNFSMSTFLLLSFSWLFHRSF